jgi:TM2 domain-containing membrane protein YozV
MTGAYMDPMAPYGRHPVTGEPLSDKSKVVAGLRQLIGLFGLFGGIIIGILTCGIGFAIPVIWAIIDAIMIFTGNVRDAQGRPLRDGT